MKFDLNKIEIFEEHTFAKSKSNAKPCTTPSKEICEQLVPKLKSKSWSKFWSNIERICFRRAKFAGKMVVLYYSKSKSKSKPWLYLCLIKRPTASIINGIEEIINWLLPTIDKDAVF